MDERLVVLALLQAKGKTLQGRTLLQKMVYFLNEELQLGIEFAPHYYGPYSADLADAVDSLVGLGFVREKVETFPDVQDPYGDQKRYSYELSPDGQEALKVFDEREGATTAAIIGEHVKLMEEHSQAHDYRNLSIAAKIHHIVKSKGKVTIPELEKEARALKWQLRPNLVKSSLDFLEEMGLVKRETSSSPR